MFVERNSISSDSRIIDDEPCVPIPDVVWLGFVITTELEDWAECRIVDLIQDGIPEDVAIEAVRLALNGLEFSY